MGFLAKVTRARAKAATEAQKYMDGWENAVNLIGTSMASLSYHRMVSGDWLTTEELQSLYEQDPIAHRIIVEPVDAAFRQGWTLCSPKGLDDEDKAKDVEKQIREHLEKIKAEPLLKKALYWGRLYGRGGLMLGARDGSSDPETELAQDKVTDLLWVRELTSDEFTSGYLNDDLESPDYGEPEVWTVTLSTGGTITYAHTSRILLTGAIPTSRERRQDNEWRDIPVLQSVYEDLRNFDSTKTGLAQMLTDASQAILQIQNLPGILAENPTLLRARMRILELSRALHILLIDAGNASGQNAEDFRFAERTFSGVAEAFDRMLGALSSAVGWPQTYLFGRSPAGENATGESDQDIWDDRVKAEQAVYLPLLQALVSLAAQALGVDDPEGWTVEFLPLRQEDPTEMAANQKTVAETDALNIANSVYEPEDVQAHRYGGDVYDPSPVKVSAETSEASKALQGQDLERAKAGLAEGAVAFAQDPTGPAAGVVGVEPAKQTFNGAQIKSAIQDILISVATKLLPRESGVAALVEFYPMDKNAAEKVMGPIGKTFFAEEPEPAPNPFEPESEGEPEEPEPNPFEEEPDGEEEE